jgi:hypothetical protein
VVAPDDLFRSPVTREVFVTRKLGFAVCSVAAIALTFSVTVVPAAASVEVVKETARTTVELSATRAADGTVTATATFSSKNPRCLTKAGRLSGPAGAPKVNPIKSVFEFGEESETPGYGPWTPDPQFGLLHGTFFAYQLTLKPVTPEGRSPWIWEAVWPGTTLLTARRWASRSPAPYPEPTKIQSPVSEAGLLGFGTGTPNPGVYLDQTTIRYKKGGANVVLDCGALEVKRAVRSL